MSGECGDSVDEANVVFSLLAETEDSSSTDVNTSFLDVLNRLEALIVCSCCDDTGVVLTTGVHVVVVCSQPGRLQLFCLLSINHAERYASLHAHLPNSRDHGFDIFQVGLAASHVTPRSTHAES